MQLCGMKHTTGLAEPALPPSHARRVLGMLATDSLTRSLTLAHTPTPCLTFGVHGFLDAQVQAIKPEVVVVQCRLAALEKGCRLDRGWPLAQRGCSLHTSSTVGCRYRWAGCRMNLGFRDVDTQVLEPAMKEGGW